MSDLALLTISLAINFYHITIEIYQINPQILLSILNSTLLVISRSQNSKGQRRHGFSDFDRQRIRAQRQKLVELYARPDRDAETDKEGA